jgi:LacI family transcriptional regulator
MGYEGMYEIDFDRAVSFRDNRSPVCDASCANANCGRMLTDMSIQRIAQIAKVPYSTTWRVINGASGVSPLAVEAVRKAMDQVGYVQPRERARKFAPATARRRHRNIAMLDLRENNSLSISILRMVQRILTMEGTNLVYGQVSGPQDLPPVVAKGEVDGILGYGQFPESAVTNDIKRIPAVWMMSPSGVQDIWGDRIMPDHRAIGQLAARYLVDKRHRHLAFLNSAPAYDFFGERGNGFLVAAEGLAESCHLVSSDLPLRPNSPEAVEQMVGRWADISPRPTGLFAPTDSATVAVYRGLSSRGIRPGKDVEVISCDRREDKLSLIDPHPVSIDLNREVIARLAIERLLWRIREQQASPSVRILVGPKLDGYVD